LDELRTVAFKAAGTLQRSVDPAGATNRNEFDALLDAMVRCGLVEIEEAEFEKDGEVRRFRKVRVTSAGLDVGPSTPLTLLIGDGLAKEFVRHGAVTALAKRGKPKNQLSVAPNASSPVQLPAIAEATVQRLKAWRAAEAKRLGWPAYMVLHDRVIDAVAAAAPANTRQLLAIDGIGPAKVERFGEAILLVCRVTSA
jgi:superfamily II DNA helicase RecQ